MWWLTAATPASPVPSPFAAQDEGPTISWSSVAFAPPGTTTGQQIHTLFPGTSLTSIMYFRSNESLSNVVVELTPSLNGVVSVNPSSFPSIIANQNYQLNITFTAPPEFKKKTFGGTIHIRNDGKPPKTYAKPLEIGFRTDWNGFKDSLTGSIFNYPPSWNLTQYQDTYTISSTTTVRHLEGDPGDEIQINILPRNGAPSLAAWLLNYFKNGEINFSSTPLNSYTNPGGVSFITLNHLPGLSSDTVGAYTLHGDHIIELSVSPAGRFNTIFSSLLSSLSY